MSAINLEKSIQTLKKCYIGKIDGIYHLDRAKLKDNLAFDFALTRVAMAIENEELSRVEFMEKLEQE